MAQQSKPFKVYCLKCKGETKHSIAKEHSTEIHDEIDGWTYDQRDVFQIIQCNGCDTVSFRHSSMNSEDLDSYTGEATVTHLIYPHRTRDHLEVKTYLGVDPLVTAIYKETIGAYNSRSVLLCAGGLRAIIEAICNSEGIDGGTVQQYRNGEPVLKPDNTPLTNYSDKLDGKINGLAEKGLLTMANASLLHEHRFLGNEALHSGRTPSPESLKAAIHIVEHILESLYQLKDQGDIIKRARALAKYREDKKKGTQE